MRKSVYEKIEAVMRHAERPLSPHQFRSVTYEGYHLCGSEAGMKYNPDGLTYIGCSESSLGRRLREMRELGRVTAQRVEGKAFVEYSLPVRVRHTEQVCPI